MHIPGKIITQLAGASVGPNLIVKNSGTDDTVVVSTAATEVLLGVTPPTVTTPSGGRVDVILDGVVEVLAGGTVTRGTWQTSTAAGACVDAAPAGGTNNGVIGVALASGVSGDLVSVRLAVGTRQG